MSETRLEKNFKHSEESKQKMSDAKKGIKNAMFGKIPSDTYRKKISEGVKQWWEKRHAHN